MRFLGLETYLVSLSLDLSVVLLILNVLSLLIFATLAAHWEHLRTLKNTDPTPRDTDFICSTVLPGHQNLQFPR